MKRYDLADQGDMALTEFPDGAYVRWDDVQALRRLLDRTREHYHHTCDNCSECLACEVESVVLDPPPRICHWKDCRQPIAKGDSYLCKHHRDALT
jgi:hypothetical protein